jgi:hypothetical protein
MPSVSKKQHNLMAAVAHNPKFAKKVGIPQSVGEEFNKADKGKQFKRGGEMKKMAKGGCAKMAKGGSIKEARMEPAKMEGMKKGNKKFGEHAIQQKGHTKGKNMGDSGKTVGMKRGGKC